MTAALSAPLPFRDDEILVQHREENFPVALRCFPSSIRAHLLAVYGFARLADDIGDRASGDRLVLLDALEHDLDRAYRGAAVHPLLQALTPTLRACALPRQPFLSLIEANRLDQRVHRYETYPDLLDYCSLSANPVGRLVLQIFGAATPERKGWSDDVCTALQIIEHCQDAAEDARRGRVYLPQEDLRRFVCAEEDLFAAVAPPCLRAVIACEVARSRVLLASGQRLVASLHGWAALAVAGFVAGGWATAEALERVEFDTLSSKPCPRRRDIARHALRLLVGRHVPR